MPTPRVLVCVSLLASFVLLAAPRPALAQSYPDSPGGASTPLPPDHVVYVDPGTTTGSYTTLSTSPLDAFAQDLYAGASRNWLAIQLRTLRAIGRSAAAHSVRPGARGAGPLRAVHGASR